MRTPKPAAGPLVTLRRRWLIAIVAVLMAPWLVVGAIYLRGDASAADMPAADAPEVRSGLKGAWGRLHVTPIVVSPPLEYVTNDLPPVQPVRWRLPGTTPDMLQSFLAWTGMPAADAAELAATARPDADIQGLTLHPSREIILRLSPDVRARLYVQLATSRLNTAQAESHRFLGDAGAWFSGSLIAPATRALVEPLLYRDGAFVHFADFDTVRAQLTDKEEVRRLSKTLARSSTLTVRVSVESDADVETMAHYWGIGGRRTDIRPLLESVAGHGAEHGVDVVHLLPPLARNLMYRYPKLTVADFDKPLLANCLWTALNFFSSEPSDRYLDVNASLATLRTDYYVVETGFQLGDVIAFIDANGVVYHAAVYMADGLAFTKNGTSSLAPWTIMSVEHIQGFYRVRSPEARLIYHRRKDL